MKQVLQIPRVVIRNSRKGRSLGQSITEFALTAPLLFILVFAIVDTARLIQAQVTVNNAARQAVRFAITGDQERDLVNGGYKTRATSIREHAIAGLGGLALTNTVYREEFGWHAVDIRPTNPPGGAPKEFVYVDVYYNVDILTPLMNAILPRVQVHGSERAINEEWGAVQSFDRANIPPAPPPLPTWTPVPTRTPTPSPTNTPTPTNTFTPTNTSTPPLTPIATSTITRTPTSTRTTTPTITRTPTRTATATPRARLTIHDLQARLETDPAKSDYRQMDIRARVRNSRDGRNMSDATVNATVIRLSTGLTVWSGPLSQIGVAPGVYRECNVGTFTPPPGSYKVTIVATHPDYDPVTVTLTPSSGDVSPCQ